MTVSSVDTAELPGSALGSAAAASRLIHRPRAKPVSVPCSLGISVGPGRAPGGASVLPAASGGSTRLLGLSVLATMLAATVTVLDVIR